MNRTIPIGAIGWLLLFVAVGASVDSGSGPNRAATAVVDDETGEFYLDRSGGGTFLVIIRGFREFGTDRRLRFVTFHFDPTKSAGFSTIEKNPKGRGALA